ncbi:hypothetical protein G7Y89_g11425 [Cudoniella acicularis]|uniref:F-box domain-containing protein n=1 Tax=Cudoniella acicularis TaxID=354080 RepID=A0A8H4RAX5_9HELO|nr:hypothetical protein G7Y89_g11425 [Cudoniella acicularis]
MSSFPKPSAQLNRLPQELLSIICECLPRTDLKSLRCVSHRLKSSVNTRMFHTITLRVNTKSFQKLRNIAADGELREIVRRICYDGRTLLNIPVPNREIWQQRIAGRGLVCKRQQFLAQFTDSELDGFYKNHCDYLAGQHFGMGPLCEEALMKEVLSRLPMITGVQFFLKEPTEATEVVSLSSLSQIGQEILSEPDRYCNPDKDGRFWTLLRMACLSGHRYHLSSVEGRHLDMENWNALGFEYEDTYTNLPALRKLSFHFHRNDWISRDDTKVLADFLAHSSRLQSLRLSFDNYKIRMGPPTFRLSYFAANQHWECLNSLFLDGLIATEIDLREFLAKHSATLRTLELRHVVFESVICVDSSGQGQHLHGSFINFLTFLNQNMSLEKVSFNGRLGNEWDEIWDVEAPDGGINAGDCLKHKIELFATRRGPFPFIPISEVSGKIAATHKDGGVPPWMFPEDFSWQFSSRAHVSY